MFWVCDALPAPFCVGHDRRTIEFEDTLFGGPFWLSGGTSFQQT